MLRLLREIGIKRDQGEPKQINMPSSKPQGHTSDPRITQEMAWKLFGEPEPTPAPQVVSEPVQAAEAKSDAHFRTEPTPPPTPDPSEEVRRAAEQESRFRELLEAEVKAIEEVKKTVLQAEEDTYRVRVRQTRFRPYVYLAGKKPVQVDSRTHGLILVGRDIGVSYPNAVRQKRSDRRDVTPLFAFGKTRIYFESAWQEAGK